MVVLVYRLRVNQKRGLRKNCRSKRMEVIGSWRKFHKEDPFITCIPHRNNSDEIKEEEFWLVWGRRKMYTIL
jgi:hypothetical protein